MASFTLLSRFMVFACAWLVLVSCVQSTVSSPSIQDLSPALFRDSDIDNAQLEIAKNVNVLEGSEENPLPESTELPALLESQGDFRAQAVLPDTSGFVYYVQHDPSNTSEPFSIFRFDQHNDVNTKIYAGKREIQAVAGSGDGNIIALSMRETTSPVSDFEVFRFFVSTLRTQRLTDNTVADTNISLSSDALKLVWEQPISGKATLILRSYTTTSTTTLFTELFLNRSEPQRQPSLSGNGRFIAFARDVNTTTDVVVRFDTVNNSYLTMAGSSTSILEHPSVSNDGNKTVYLQNRPVGNDLLILRTVNTATTQTVVTSPTLEHPFLSADGQFVTYGQLENNVIKVFTKNLSNNSTLRITNPVSPINHLAMSWQLPFASQQKVIPFNGPGGERFGSAVAVSGSLMVVAAPKFGFSGEGSAYLLSRNALGTWTVFKKLSPSDRGFSTSFGFAVAMSGNTVVVGDITAPHDTDGDGRLEQNVGAAYIFERNQGGSDNWGEVKKVIPSDARFGSFFGAAVTVSGDLMVVGTAGVGEHVYVFGRNQGGTNQWGEIKKLVASDGAGFASFGGSVALSGDTLVVGAPRKDVDTNNDGTDENNVGAAYIFQKDQGGTDNWGEVKKLTASDFADGDSFGNAVAISGDVVVVGALFDDHDTTKDGIDELDAGAAYIFERNQGGSNIWGEVKKLVASDGVGEPKGPGTPRDLFGASVAISGNTIVVGAREKQRDTNTDGNLEERVGAAYIFERNQGGTNTWREVRKLLAVDGATEDTYGQAVAISGQVIVVGSPNNDNSNGTDAGAIYADER
jgi:Tol biopolymer transport system component